MSPVWADEIGAWTLALTAARCSRETIGLRTYHVRRLALWARERSPWSLTLDDLLSWTGAQRWGRETARSVRSSLRRFWSWAVLTGRTAVDVAAGLPVIPPAKPSPRPAPPSAVATALHESDPRVVLMVMLADDLGMRRGEVARAHTDDLVADLDGWSLHVHGKGSRDRVVPLPNDLARTLRALPPGYFFPGAVDGHLSARWVGRLVGRALPGDVTMHQLRHRCATDLHRQTKDLRLVQELLGHASVATTQRYVAVENDAMRRAVAARSARRVA